MQTGYIFIFFVISGSLFHLHDSVTWNCPASSTCSFHSASSDPRTPTSHQPHPSAEEEDADSPTHPSSPSNRPHPSNSSLGAGEEEEEGEGELSHPISDSSQSNQPIPPSLKLSSGEDDGVSMETTSSKDLLNGSKMSHLEGRVSFNLSRNQATSNCGTDILILISFCCCKASHTITKAKKIIKIPNATKAFQIDLMHMTSQKDAPACWGSNEALPCALLPSMQPAGQPLHAIPPGQAGTDTRTHWEPTLFQLAQRTCMQRVKSWPTTWRRCYGDVTSMHKVYNLLHVSTIPITLYPHLKDHLAGGSRCVLYLYPWL